MIISYKFKNFKSFKDEQTFYMTPVNKIKALEENLYTIKTKYNLLKESNNKLLKIAVISGQNASGKSNFIKSFDQMSLIIRNSFEKNFNQLEESVPIISYHESFMYLDKESPRSFEVQFLSNSKIYTYGFEFNRKEIITEFLNVNEKGKVRKFFERKHNKVKYGNKENIKDTSKKFIKTILKTRPDSLLLSISQTLGENGRNQELKDVFTYFIDNVQLVSEVYKKISIHVLAKELLKAKNKTKDEMTKSDEICLQSFDLMKTFIKSLDTRIVDMELSEDIEQEYPFISIHEYTNTKGEKLRRRIPFAQESDGTKKLFMFSLPILITLIGKNNVLIIDEMDSQIHTNLFIELVQLFNNSENQLIFTTHNPYILDQSLLRNDQIYFVDKNNHEESEIYSLSDFKGVRKTDSYKKRYLNGSYGAVPIIDFSELKRKLNLLGDSNG